jgi:hypothetical protein
VKKALVSLAVFAISMNNSVTAQQLTNITVEGRPIQVRLAEFDMGYAFGRAWVDVNGDGEVDYCRIGGDPPNHRVVECTLFKNGVQGATFESLTSDWGYDTGRQWIDANGDNKIDYCRIRGNPPHPFYECMLGSGDGNFGDSKPFPSMDSQIPDFLKRVETTCSEQTMCRSGTEVARIVCKSTDGKTTEGPWRPRGKC